MNSKQYRDKLRELKKRHVNIRLNMRKEEEKLINDKITFNQPIRMNSEDNSDIQNRGKGGKNAFYYTIRDYEYWETKSNLKVNKRLKGLGDVDNNVNYQNYDILAKNTYDRDISDLPYNDKTMLDKTKTGNSAIEYTESGILVHDDRAKLQDLANRLITSSKKRYNKRAKEIARSLQTEYNNTNYGGYINIKNKQFNEKLDREYKNYT
ncbi:Syf2p SCDLUD_002379 [Saccharomycodes ludwigii]|uniref:Syf2p n=1 Tax=Saccharomycodes ludwigii TaxID=36035 RepID=UPI001E880596|nr:hypothetical protein SCDLUD_002379 [Saccharomycodes ludwigii]KAH3900919.1 hypothetical protein SCDLUD_002379 [Saccharomycodes ludwigii]